MADKPIQIVSGSLKEVEANTSSAGSGDAGKIVALGSDGKIDDTFLHDATSEMATASEDIAAGALINIFNSSGLKVRNADNTSSSKEAIGFAPAAIASAASGRVIYGPGLITGLSALTIGAQYFLSTVGAITVTAPTASGAIVQKVGRATSTTELAFIPGEPVLRA